MKKLFVMILFTMMLLGQGEIHPSISTKELIDQGYTSYDIYLSLWMDLNTSEIRFREAVDPITDEDVIEMYLWENYVDEEDDCGIRDHKILYLPKESEIIDVFFEDITLDGFKEFFVLTRMDGRYHIKFQTIAYYRSHYYFDGNAEFEKELNEKFGDYKELDAETIKRALEGKLLIDYESYTFDGKEYYQGGEKLAYLKSTEDGYVEVRSLKEGDIYVKTFGNGVYAFYNRYVTGYDIRELFEGREMDEPPYFIRDGKYNWYEPTRSIEGTYKNGKKDGHWIYHERLTTQRGMYINDLREGEWIEEGFELRLIGSYKNGVKDGLWVEEYSGEETMYIDGVEQK